MFKGFRWYDWLIGIVTYGAWIVFKILRNYGLSTKKIVIGLVGAVVVLIGGGAIYESTDIGKSRRLEYALRENKLDIAERILKDNPAIKTGDGLTAAEVVEKVKANFKAWEEAQLALAKSKGYASYAEMQVAEEKIAAEARAAEARAAEARAAEARAAEARAAEEAKLVEKKKAEQVSKKEPNEACCFDQRNSPPYKWTTSDRCDGSWGGDYNYCQNKMLTNPY